MKKKSLALSLLFGLVSSLVSLQATNETKAEVVDHPIQMTKNDFIAKVMDYTKSTSEWNYLGDKPCIIDFYANWCGPCRRLAPILDEIAKEYAGQIYVYKVNTDEQKELAALFNIRSIPSMLFVPMKGQPQMTQGLLPKESLVEQINNFLLK